MAVFTENFPTWILRISRDCLIETRLAELLSLPLFLSLSFSLSLHFDNRHSVFLRSSYCSHLLIYPNLIFFPYSRLWSNLNSAHTKVLCFYVVLGTLILSKVFCQVLNGSLFVTRGRLATLSWCVWQMRRWD